jgi:hypothetical protein
MCVRNLTGGGNLPSEGAANYTVRCDITWLCLLLPVYQPSSTFIMHSVHRVGAVVVTDSTLALCSVVHPLGCYTDATYAALYTTNGCFWDLTVT